MTTRPRGSERWLLGPLAAVALVCASPRAGATPPSDPDPWFAPDKALHFGVSAVISGASYGLSAIATDDIRIRVAFGAGAGITVGAAKELLDLAGLGHASWKDFAWDVFGTIVGVGISVAIDFAVRGSRVAATAR